ncbi:hypothetical protein LIA77_04061 [Sarocladium implicatum]|nr:hypothetical protein LIA77_04061 [Sarocladium implicatum]
MSKLGNDVDLISQAVRQGSCSTLNESERCVPRSDPDTIGFLRGRLSPQAGSCRRLITNSFAPRRQGTLRRGRVSMACLAMTSCPDAWLYGCMQDQVPARAVATRRAGVGEAYHRAPCYISLAGCITSLPLSHGDSLPAPVVGLQDCSSCWVGYQNPAPLVQQLVYCLLTDMFDAVKLFSGSGAFASSRPSVVTQPRYPRVAST